MIEIKNFTVFFLLLINFSFILAQTIRIVTEEYPPYNYTNNEGKITGFSTEVVEAVLKKLNYQYNIESFPWARTYMIAQKEENTLIYSIVRTKEREQLFKWVGVVAPFDVYLYSLKERNDIAINKLDDAKRYKTLTTLNDILDKYLSIQGFTDEHIDNTAQNEVNFEKLLRNRGDLWPVGELTANYYVLKKGMNPDDILKKQLHLKDASNDGLYMAFSLYTEDKIVDEFRHALQEIKDEGIYNKIKQKHNIN